MNQIAELKEKTKTLTLLYVEDDPASREQISVILEMFFGTLTVAEDGCEGWECYQKSDFDLVITDINMPCMSGIELTQKIKSLNPLQKVVIVSAHDSGDYLLSAIRAGVDNFILKPVEMEQFEGVIKKVATAIHNEKLHQHYQNELEREVTSKTQELMQQAVTDDLTGLYNRKMLTMKLEKYGVKVLMLLNIDNFDNINATYGYGNGDLIMQKIAHFLKAHLHPSATLFRLGHDEFAFLFTTVKLGEAEAYARELQHLISQKPITHEAITVKFTATVVLAEGEKDLLKDVHIAFKEARAIGKNRIGVYRHDSGLERRQKEIQQSMHILIDALEKRMVVPYFQPIINNQTRRVEKYECLARIIHDGKVLTPGFFIETAELTGVLPEITRLMIEKSFEYFKNRTEEFSINISEHDLNDSYLDAFLEENIVRYGIDPSRVVLEVLEGLSAHGAEKSFDQLSAFKARGFQLAIDDFGAQNSNFERVHRLKVDYIKIDGSFIKQIDQDLNSYRVAKTITDFSKSIGAKVVAEYVHSEAVLQKVVELGIDYSQGFYFAEPSAEIEGEEL
ncbi:MAG: EAL domain-containing protein [Campylobacterota bacterium]|nr:EAL domain-containing protein [Campylobacterota bacterium]